MSPRLTWLYHEFGLASVVKTGKDAWLIILCRTCRMFAYSAASAFIALFFAALEFSDFRIGLFLTFTLLGDVVLTLGLTFIADHIGRRKTLLLGSVMMIFSGLIFVYFENFWILLFAAVVGIISASGGDFGPFRAIEESMISQLCTPETRSDVLSWYVTSASLGSAIGIEGAGRGVDHLKRWAEWSDVKAYHSLFGLYIVMGLVNAISVFCLSVNTEAAELVEKQRIEEEEEVLLEETDRMRSLEVEASLNTDGTAQRVMGERPSSASGSSAEKPASRFTQISKDTRRILYKLWPLLIVDTFADGMVSLSLTTYYVDRKFDISASSLGDIVSISYFLAALSTIFAAPLTHRLGLVNTMVFTHIPSSAAVLFFPLPTNLIVTILLFFIRVGLNNMDQAPRAAFIAAVVKPSERTSVNGMTSMFRTLASTAGPTVTGWLAGHDMFWISFVAAGILRLAYDFGLWALFVNLDVEKHEEEIRQRG